MQNPISFILTSSNNKNLTPLCISFEYIKMSYISISFIFLKVLHNLPFFIKININKSKIIPMLQYQLKNFKKLPEILDKYALKYHKCIFSLKIQ